MSEYKLQTARVLARINELAVVSEQPGCITRTYGSDAFSKSCRIVEGWMNEAGLQTRIDQIGNVRGLLPGSNPEAKTLVIASHIDTVVNAGKFDGPLGVVLAIELAAQLHTETTPFPFQLEVIAFCDEEGVRFHSTYLGSKAVAGCLEPELLMRKDEAGISLSDCIAGLGGNSRLLDSDAIAPGKWLGYFEVHIEQGPVLWQCNVPIALVTGIAGQKRAELIFCGTAGHAGTVPMNMRSDALCAASEFIIETEKYALQHHQQVVATVGKLQVAHAACNVIPGHVSCSLDVRSIDANFLEMAYGTLRLNAEAICSRRNVQLNWMLTQQTLPITCDGQLNKILAASIEEAGYPLVQLASGAGHDAVAVSAVSPVAMLFVRCFEGISHNPLENVEEKDIAAALKTSRIFINRFISHVANG